MIMETEGGSIDDEIEQAFNAIDKDGNGTLDIDEVGRLFESLGQTQTPEEVRLKDSLSFQNKLI